MKCERKENNIFAPVYNSAHNSELSINSFFLFCWLPDIERKLNFSSRVNVFVLISSAIIQIDRLCLLLFLFSVSKAVSFCAELKMLLEIHTDKAHECV